MQTAKHITSVMRVIYMNDRIGRSVKYPLGATLLLVAACANVTVTQVDDRGKHRSGAVEGFYLPRLMPYLVVADLPPDQAPPSKPSATKSNDPGGHAGNGGHHNPRHPLTYVADPKKTAKGKGGDDTSSPDASSPSPGATSSASDLSFAAVTKSYVMKLIYLPDYSHQQAISTSSGLFGKATLNLQLADGTLTSLQANMDSTENGEVFKSALTAATTAASGGIAGIPAVAKDAATKATDDLRVSEYIEAVRRYKAYLSAPRAAGVALLAPPQPPPAAPPAPTDSYLHPGLYEIDFDKTGKFTGLHKVTGFCPMAGLTNDPNECTRTK